MGTCYSYPVICEHINLSVCRWYCHADDDAYFNAKSLNRELSKYDPYKEHVYLGQWRGLTKVFFKNVDRLEVGSLHVTVMCY